MKRTILTATVAAVLAIGAAGCGTSSTHSTSKTHAVTTTVPVQTPTQTPTQTPAELQTGYFNMDVLASDLTTTVQAKMDADPTYGGAIISDVTCISTGTLTAECNGTYDNGQAESVTVHISPDGQTYITAAA